VIVSAVTVSFTGMIPMRLVKIGKWSPHVGSSSRVHVRVELSTVVQSIVQWVWAKCTCVMFAVTFGSSVPVKTRTRVEWS
jgi:hypothetical protein